MTTGAPARVQSGLREGGQFATQARPEPDLVLAPSPHPICLSWRAGDDPDGASATYPTTELAQAAAERLSAAGLTVQMQALDESATRWVPVRTYGPPAADAGEPVRFRPASVSATRKALNMAAGSPDGRDRVVELTWAADPRRRGADVLMVRGPVDGTTLHVDVLSGFFPMKVESGRVVVHARSQVGTAVDVQDGATCEVVADRGVKVSTTTRAGGRTLLTVAERSHGLQFVDDGGHLAVLGPRERTQIRVAGPGTQRAATVCALCRQVVHLGEDGTIEHQDGRPCAAA
jgi:hypothetical protein